jgi:simple sugar transport system ATP-binding protein
MRERAGAIVARNLAPAHLDVQAKLLAGRDIQNLIFARTLERKPLLLIADRPTRGLDAAAAAAVHRRLSDQRDAGVGILLISDDVDELLNHADAIAVLHEGRLTHPQPTGALDETSLGHMMGGRGSMALDWAGWGEGT